MSILRSFISTLLYVWAKISAIILSCTVSKRKADTYNYQSDVELGTPQPGTPIPTRIATSPMTPQTAALHHPDIALWLAQQSRFLPVASKSPSVTHSSFSSPLTQSPLPQLSPDLSDNASSMASGSPIEHAQGLASAPQNPLNDSYKATYPSSTCILDASYLDREVMAAFPMPPVISSQPARPPRPVPPAEPLYTESFDTELLSELIPSIVLPCTAMVNAETGDALSHVNEGTSWTLFTPQAPRDTSASDEAIVLPFFSPPRTGHKGNVRCSGIVWYSDPSIQSNPSSNATDRSLSHLGMPTSTSPCRANDIPTGVESSPDVMSTVRSALARSVDGGNDKAARALFSRQSDWSPETQFLPVRNVLEDDSDDETLDACSLMILPANIASFSSLHSFSSLRSLPIIDLEGVSSSTPRKRLSSSVKRVSLLKYATKSSKALPDVPTVVLNSSELSILPYMRDSILQCPGSLGFTWNSMDDFVAELEVQYEGKNLSWSDLVVLTSDRTRLGNLDRGTVTGGITTNERLQEFSVHV